MRGRPLVVDWSDSLEELELLRDTERNGHRRARLQALCLLRSGHTIGEAGAAAGVDYRTVQRWVQWYREGGLQAVLARTPGYAAPGRPSRLSEDQIGDLIRRSQDGEFRTVTDAVSWVRSEFGVDYTYTGMYALLGRRGSDTMVRPEPPQRRAS